MSYHRKYLSRLSVFNESMTKAVWLEENCILKLLLLSVGPSLDLGGVWADEKHSNGSILYHGP